MDFTRIMLRKNELSNENEQKRITWNVFEKNKKRNLNDSDCQKRLKLKFQQKHIENSQSKN